MRSAHGGVLEAAGRLPAVIITGRYYMSLLNIVLDRLGGDSLEGLTKQVGADEAATQSAIAAALPMLMGALTRNASKPEGAASLHRALAKHDGSVLDNLSGLFGSGDTSDGEGILKHALGDRRGLVEQSVAKSSGLDLAKVGPLLAMLAPVVMGVLGKQQRESNLDEGGLSDMLRQDRRTAEAAVPQLKGMRAMFDRDGDGEIADDLMGLLTGGGLGGLLGGRR